MINRQTRGSDSQVDIVPTTIVAEGTQTVQPRDRVRWGPVWAGLVTALTAFLTIELFLHWIGALVNTLGPNNQVAADPNAGWVTALVAFAAFFLGGCVAGASAAVGGSGAGLLNGFLVWALGIVLILAFSAFGLGSLFGAVGSAFTGLVGAGGGSGAKIDPSQFVTTSRTAAGWGLLFLVLSAVAAAVGGMTGDKSRSDRKTGAVH